MTVAPSIALAEAVALAMAAASASSAARTSASAAAYSSAASGLLRRRDESVAEPKARTLSKRPGFGGGGAGMVMSCVVLGGLAAGRG